MQLRDMVLRAAARYNLPIRWLPDRLAEQNFAMQEPPSKASPWVKVLLGHLQTLRQRLNSQEGLAAADVVEVGNGLCTSHTDEVRIVSLYPLSLVPMPSRGLATVLLGKHDTCCLLCKAALSGSEQLDMFP